MNGEIGIRPVGGLDPTGEPGIVRRVQKRKWFQVTRSRSQTPRRHATAQSFATRIAGRLPIRSPPPSFEGNGSMLPGSPANSSSWNRYLEAAFHSPETTACLPATISRSKLPTCCFDTPPRVHLARSDSRFPHALRFAPLRAGSLPQSRCPTLVRHSQPFLGSPLPFGAFRTLKDQSVQSDSWPGSSPSERSRLPFTPRHRFYFTSSTPDHRSELAKRSVARCSSDLLEPLSSCTPLACYSQMKIVFQNHFPQLLFYLAATT